jgi:hypothetical protein
VSANIQKSKHLKESSFPETSCFSRSELSKAGVAIIWRVAWSLEKFPKHSLLFYFTYFISRFSWCSRQIWGMPLFLYTPLNFVTGNMPWQSVSSRLFYRPLGIAGSQSRHFPLPHTQPLLSLLFIFRMGWCVSAVRAEAGTVGFSD